MTLVMITFDNINALQLVAPNYVGSYIDFELKLNTFLVSNAG